MGKREAYTWRLTSALKGDLEKAARRRGVTVAELLEEIVEDWLARDLGARGREELEEEKLRQKASPVVGAFDGGDPERSSESKKRIRRRLQERRSAEPV